MAIAINPSTALVNASTAASGMQAVTNPDDYREHQYLVTLSVAGTVTIQGSVDGTRYGALNDADDGGAAQITATGTIRVRGVWPYMRISWAGNTGTLTVDLVQHDDRQT